MDLPKHVSRKRLASGVVAFYFTVPPWARERDHCPVTSERLPDAPGKMLERAEALNETLDQFRDGRPAQTIKAGTVAWLGRWFAKHRKVTKRTAKTQSDYAKWFALVVQEQVRLEEEDEGKKVGDYQIRAIDHEIADLIYEAIQWTEKTDKDGKTVRRRRLRTANAAMAVARRAWKLAIRAGHADINPFAKMDLEATDGRTAPVSRRDLQVFIAAADKVGMPSVGTAALITFELIQREVDVIGTFGWSHIKPDRVRVIHHKTRKEVWLPLYDEDGPLFPDLIDRLEHAPRRGPLVVMRDTPARHKGGETVFLPYNEHLFRKHFRKVRTAAGLPDKFTFLACRHGGMTEAGDSEMTDQEMVSVSGRTRQTLSVYTHKTETQKLNALRKRRAFRLAGEQNKSEMSE